MKILPINVQETNNNFKGLHRYSKDFITDADYMSLTRQRVVYIHPFADDTEAIINAEAASLSGSLTYPGIGDCQVEKLITNAKVSKTLSFTKAEFQKYKHFYDKTLPENFKKIERELYLSGLGKYINDGFIYKVKCFLHSLKR